MPKFIHTTTGQELTAGQALDVVLEKFAANVDKNPISGRIHVFCGCGVWI